MQVIRTLCVVIIGLILPVAGWTMTLGKTQIDLQEKMLRELDILKNTFDVKYAPAEWKKSYSGWDLEEQITRAKVKVLASKNISIKDFQQIVKTFFNSTRDYHVGAYFFSTESAFLPFRVQSVNNKYFVIWVDSEAGSLPLMVGDEVIQFDNKPIHDVVMSIKERELGNEGSLTDQALAEYFLTARGGVLGHQVPSGIVSISYKHPNTHQINTCDLQWAYTPEEIHHTPFQLSLSMRQPEVNAPSTPSYNFFHKPMIAACYEPMHEAFQKSRQHEMDADGAELLGGKKSLIPPLGKILWENSPEKGFHAYLYETNSGHTVGYIRIASFMKRASDAKEFADLINFFESQSDALVIDQLNNPGGDMFYMYALASMLATSPLKVPKQRITITQEDLYYAISSLKDLEREGLDNISNASAHLEIEDTISGYPVTREFIKGLIEHFRHIVNEWNAGQTFTRSANFFGISQLIAHPWANYSKPILLLVNQLDISCGDFFPAILQDNNRATIFGTRTAGAGGAVIMHSYPNRFGIAGYSFTMTIAERLNLNPIENLGIIPDIECAMTEEDLQFGYKDYVASVEKAVNQLLVNQNPTHKPPQTPSDRFTPAGGGR